MNVNLRVDNKELMKSLQAFPKKLQNKIVKSAGRAGMKKVAEGAKSNAPVDTGHLKKNIKVRMGKRSRMGFSINVIVGDAGLNNYYPRFIEKGTKFIEAREYMLTAYHELGNEAIRITVDELKRLVDEAQREAS